MSQSRRISLVLALNAAMIAALLIVGFASRSVGVLAEAGDFVADSAALGLGLYAIHRRDRHGNAQATTWVALINAVVLVAITAVVATEAIRRLIYGGPAVHGWAVLVVSGLAAAVMLAAALILGADAGSEDLHMRSILVDTIADGVAAAVVAVVGAIIAIRGDLDWLDSAAALLVAGLVIVVAVRLLRDVVDALRSGHALDPAHHH